MRIIINVALIVGALFGVCASLNMFVWGPLGTIENLRSGNPHGGHIAILIISFLVSLMFVGIVLSEIEQNHEKAKKRRHDD